MNNNIIKKQNDRINFAVFSSRSGITHKYSNGNFEKNFFDKALSVINYLLNYFLHNTKKSKKI